MNRFLPDPEISMKKFGHLYRYEDVVLSIRKNRMQIAQTYLVLGIFLLTAASILLFRSLHGEDCKKDIYMISLIFCSLFFLIYKTRYRSIEKQVKKIREAIKEDFPELIEKTVLLLNAGMVTETALRKICEDYGKTVRITGRRALYDGLTDIIGKMRESNLPLASGLSEYAVRSGVRELMRFAAIVEDNLSKGSELTEKLEGEGALLWMSRKKHAEEKARLAETKLSFPLLLLLLSVMIVTTAPMLLCM